MYSAKLGRFVSRDRLKYINGYSLYGAYFAPNWKDPSGNSCCKDQCTVVGSVQSGSGTDWRWVAYSHNGLNPDDQQSLTDVVGNAHTAQNVGDAILTGSITHGGAVSVGISKIGSTATGVATGVSQAGGELVNNLHPDDAAGHVQNAYDQHAAAGNAFSLWIRVKGKLCTKKKCSYSSFCYNELEDWDSGWQFKPGPFTTADQPATLTQSILDLISDAAAGAVQCH